jgi:crossover junction endodeoxyribonuclease RuvC
MDMSLRSSGIAVIETIGASNIKTCEYHVVRNPVGRKHSECLLNIFRAVQDIISAYRPQVAAIEGIFFCKNIKTAVTLGETRGVAMAACAGKGVPVFEYSPRRVKQAVVGYGSAGKEQVRRMVMAILQLKEEPHSDAADALAIAICHAHAARRLNVLNVKRL